MTEIKIPQGPDTVNNGCKGNASENGYNLTPAPCLPDRQASTEYPLTEGILQRVFGYNNVMTVCGICREEISIEKKVSRRSVCPACGADLHICLNCKYYSETSHNKCIEPKAEYQRCRDKANFCDYFSIREGGAASSGSDREAALKRLNDLFRK